MLHLIPQMGKHRTTTSEALFHKLSLSNLDSPVLLLQQQSLCHKSHQYSLHDTIFRRFTKAGNSSLLFEHYVH